MARTTAIGHQNFETIRKNDYFYIDKTHFIQEWWKGGDSVTLITRPRRFGKTLNMSMTEQFFSVKYAGRGDLFEGLSVWEDPDFRSLQGTYPVLFLSFAGIKERTCIQARKQICQLLTDLYNDNDYLLESGLLNAKEKEEYRSVSADMEDYLASASLRRLSGYLARYYKKKVIILLDEYDAPMQEAYVQGYWDELMPIIRAIFNFTFKTNPYMERAIMTGITRVSRESVFSDLNNLEVVTTTSEKYAGCFGFTEEEVFASLDEFNLGDKKEEVKKWYDGFTFGSISDIYNPWSVINFLDKKELGTYWANTSGNSLVGRLIRQGSRGIKTSFERLLEGECLITPVDEQLVYEQLDESEEAVWSLLLAGGYLRVLDFEKYGSGNVREARYRLKLTNLEVTIMFRGMIRMWFSSVHADYNDFVKALLRGELEAMNGYMNRVAEETFSFFDTGGQTDPERFYHGFVLGLIVELSEQYRITSNRESGFGRYDVLLEPKQEDLYGIILEFKVHNPSREACLEDTVKAALEQIENKKYAVELVSRGISPGRIRRYGFAFQGKRVLIGGDSVTSGNG